MATFMIKHKPSGKFVHPFCGPNKPKDNEHLVIYDGSYPYTEFKFEPQDNNYGFIVHVNSGKAIHVYGGGKETTHDGDTLVLHGDRHPGAYFALDQVHDHIIHRLGRYLHTKKYVRDPPNRSEFCLHHVIHDCMEFQFVSPKDTNKEVLPYGEPKLLGDWKIINMVLTPIAEHTSTMEFKVGKSKTESTSSSFEYKWEASAGLDIDMFSFGASTSMTTMLENTSSSTWSVETTKTRQIKVSPGKSCVTWQFVYEMCQNDHKSVFKSNLLADTDSEQNPPRDLGFAV